MRTIVSKAQSCPARRAASRAFSSTTSRCIEWTAAPACWRISINRVQVEAVGASLVDIGHLLELFLHKGRAVRQQDPAGLQFAKQCHAVCIDEGDLGKIQHEAVS